MILDGKRILVTGGTGSFGNALIDYLKDMDVSIIIYSRDEKKQYDMKISRASEKVTYVIGDVRDRQKLIYSMRNVDYVFHAAALKHVPTGENFPEEVVYTNTLGTKKVIEAAEFCGVKKVVTLSTDKAVYPVNAYGMSKALAEKIILAHKGETPNVCLRCGNVLGTRGSVVPLFLDQISQDRPLTITNPRMTRFLLTLEEMLKLALKCLQEGKNGELYVIRSPACSIRTLVEALQLHFKREFPKMVIGIRPGEKMDETLLTGDEVRRSAIEHEDGIAYAKVLPLDRRRRDLCLADEDYREPEPFTSANTEQYDARRTLEKISEAGLL